MYNYLEVNDLYFQPRPQGFLHFLRRKSPGDEAGEEWRCQLVVWTVHPLGGGGGRGVLLGILDGDVLPSSSNPDPISDQKSNFPDPFSD